ncbi:hypothetical protein LX36DRAFT_662214 [Colletotrichum falcatum]|nr:hypothetical protein LX36DRAFT_662214 [Colletotrichum falcatum]
MFKLLPLAILLATAQAAKRPVMWHCECRTNGITDSTETEAGCRGAGQMRDGVCVVMQHKVGDFGCNNIDRHCIKQQ